MEYPFLRPNPPRLSKLAAALEEIEASGIYTGYGPVNRRLEKALIERSFGGNGACVTVCNATTGLMLAIRNAIGFTSDRERPSRRSSAGRARYALMPSFTFAATAHAALWCGLTPLLCDIDSDAWTSSPASEDELLEQYKDEIAVIVPYATFGSSIDLDRYARLTERHGIPAVIDAAASLGSRDVDARQFGAGFAQPVVYSMHATKPFATAEAGLIYCSDARTIETLRAMGNFGFGEPRTATMPGLNAKLSEIGALLALEKLSAFDDVVAHRTALAEQYRLQLPGWTFQDVRGQPAFQFMPALLPRSAAPSRGAIVSWLNARGVGVGQYFSPHLAEHPYLRDVSLAGDLAVTSEVASRVLCLPMSDTMTIDDVTAICASAAEAAEAVRSVGGSAGR